MPQKRSFTAVSTGSANHSYLAISPAIQRDKPSKHRLILIRKDIEGWIVVFSAHDTPRASYIVQSNGSVYQNTRPITVISSVPSTP